MQYSVAPLSRLACEGYTYRVCHDDFLLDFYGEAFMIKSQILEHEYCDMLNTMKIRATWNSFRLYRNK